MSPSVTPEPEIEFRNPMPWWAAPAIFAGLALILALIVTGMVVIPRLQSVRPVSELQRSDAARSEVDDYYVDLTLVTPGFMERRNLRRYIGERDPERVLPMLMGINTHTGTIEHIHDVTYCGGDMNLIGPEGTAYPALTEPIVLSAHHNAYLVLFPARDRLGRRFLDLDVGSLTVVVKDVGRIPERRFEWELPVASELDGLPRAEGVVGFLMLLFSVAGALLVVLSPCALELTLYYSAIISSAISPELPHGSPAESLEEGRRRLAANLGSFVLGFTLLYGLSGATVGLIGEGVRRPLERYGEVFQVFGGLLILFFALRVLGADAWLARRLGRAPGPGSCATPYQPGPVGRLLIRIREAGLRRIGSGEPLGPWDSFLVGLGLSASCLTCMGSAVLYPLLVYAGITSWYWGMVTLVVYSLGIALPMMLVALGAFRIRAALGHRAELGRGLRVLSGVLLVGISLLVMSGNERVLTDVFFGVLGQLSRWSA